MRDAIDIGFVAYLRIVGVKHSCLRPTESRNGKPLLAFEFDEDVDEYQKDYISGRAKVDARRMSQEIRAVKELVHESKSSVV